MLKDQEDEIYVPVSLRTLRKLDQLVMIFETAGEGYTEDRIISMGLDNLLASMRQHDNDNSDTPPVLPPDVPSDCGVGSRSAIGLSNPEMPAG